MAALLAGCATGGSDIRWAACGWLKDYTPELQSRAAEELSRLAPGAAVAHLVDDYGELRARLRAACATR
jgi:hypothetical protein